MDLGQEILLMLGGVGNTLIISILSFFMGILLGLPLAFVRAYEKDLAIFVDVFEKVFRGVPEIVLMLLFYFGLGLYLPFPFGNVFFTATFVLGLRSAANQSQIFRGAIRGVGEEQMVAGRSLGLSTTESITHVMMPQVFIFSTPGLGSEYALLIKDSAYAWVLGVAELFKNMDLVRANTYNFVTPYAVGALLYIALTFPIATWLDSWGNKKKKELGL